MVRDYDSFSSLRFFLLFNAAGIESEQANSYGIFLVFVCLLVSPSGGFRNVEGIVCIILYYMIASYPLFASVGHLPREGGGGLGDGGGRVFFHSEPPLLPLARSQYRCNCEWRLQTI